ncbi:MAG: YkgJ family cysteine cluster protein [Deltaproteobacteria bacterium]|nr:YkgJ family cysteine cluster protein [Deltaproteobacteria bacterium]
MSLSTLCQACGLCCDGSLFTFVSVDAEQGKKLLARDVALELRKDGVYRLHQRCASLEGTRCQIYEDRPGPCRSYVCLLGTALQEGELSLRDSLELVAQAHARIAELDATLPVRADARTGTVQRVRQSRAGEGPALPDDAVAAWERVRDLLQRVFTGRHGMR